MASAFGHAASIIGLKKIFPDRTFGNKALLLGIASSIVPDLDVLGYEFGVSSSHILGHRGFTHSLLFAFAWAVIIIFLFHKKQKNNYLLLLIFYFLCTASHGLLDAMTTGGEGVAFLFPFSDGRFFLPWRHIQVSPIGASSFFSEWGVKVLMSELKYIGIPSLLLFGLGFLMNKKLYK